MASIDAAEGANWQRQAKRLLKDIRDMISSHRREYSVGLAVEFAMVQDTRVTGLVGLGEPLFDCVHHLALSQLKTYDEKLPFTRLWGGKIESCVGRTRVFCTNLPPYSQLKLESSEREARLLQIFRDVNRLFQEGKILLEAMPSQLADLVALNLGECEWRAQGPVVEESRWVGFTDGCEWLSTLFAASWGPANKCGLVGKRSTIRETSQEITREVANRYMEVPYQGSRAWASSGCFFSISRDVLRDSVRLIDWLLSLVQSEEASETPKPDAIAKAVEVPPLSEKQYLILETMWELQALSADTRKTADQIAVRCDGMDADVNVFKPLLSDLTRNHKLTQSKPGRGGGSWLTEKGIEVTKRVIDNAKSNVPKR